MDNIRDIIKNEYWHISDRYKDGYNTNFSYLFIYHYRNDMAMVKRYLLYLLSVTPHIDLEPMKAGVCEQMDLVIYSQKILIRPMKKTNSQILPVLIDCSNCMDMNINHTTIREIISNCNSIVYDSGYNPKDNSLSKEYHQEEINNLIVILKKRYTCVTYCEKNTWKMIATKIHINSLRNNEERIQCIEKFFDKKFKTFIGIGRTLVVKGDCSTWEFIDINSLYLVEQLFYKIFITRTSETEFDIINNVSPILMYYDYGLVGESYKEEHFNNIFKMYNSKICKLDSDSYPLKIFLVTLKDDKDNVIAVTSNQSRIILSLLAHNNFKIVKSEDITGTQETTTLYKLKLNKILFDNNNEVLSMTKVFEY